MIPPHLFYTLTGQKSKIYYRTLLMVWWRSH